MRHVLLPGAPATRPYRVGQPTATARLVALAGRVPGVISRLLRTAAGAVDLAAVAVAADQHLSAAARTHEQPSRRRPARTWTTSAILGIMPRHACSARCGARRRAGLGGLGRRRARQSGRLSPRHCALDARRHAAGRAHACGHVDNARALPTCPQAQQPTIRIKFDCFAMAGAQTQRVTPAPASVRAANTSPISRRHLCADSDSHSHGVQRTSVSIVANTLQQLGLIRYRRGHIRVLDLESLRESSCECYQTLKSHSGRLLGSSTEK